jgi:hypothetical protein
LPYRLLPFEFVFQGFNLLLSVEFLLAEGFTGLELVILHFDGEELPAFPASVRTLIAWLSQGKTALGGTLGTFDFDYHDLTSLLLNLSGLPFFFGETLSLMDSPVKGSNWLCCSLGGHR